MIITFGRKHKKKNIEDVYNFDKNYCLWLYTQPFIKGYPEIYDFLKSKFHNENEIYLDFGRYKNKPLSYVIKTDMKYIYFLHSQEFVKHSNKKLFKIIDYVVNNVKVEDYY